jgi:hypothetical protein
VAIPSLLSVGVVGPAGADLVVVVDEEDESLLGPALPLRQPLQQVQHVTRQRLQPQAVMEQEHSQTKALPTLVTWKDRLSLISGRGPDHVHDIEEHVMDKQSVAYESCTLTSLTSMSSPPVLMPSCSSPGDA